MAVTTSSLASLMMATSKIFAVKSFNPECERRERIKLSFLSLIASHTTPNVFDLQGFSSRSLVSSFSELPFFMERSFQLSCTVHHGKYLHIFSLRNSVDDPVVLINDFSKLVTLKFGNDATALGHGLKFDCRMNKGFYEASCVS